VENKEYKEIKIIDLVDTIQYNKNISKKNLLRVLKALPKVFKEILLTKKQIVFENFMSFGFRTAKDRMVRSRPCKVLGIESKMFHMPAHLRFKAVFFKETKDYLNEKKESNKK